MHSEFNAVALDRLRYSLVWEDSHALYDGLDLQPHNRVLVITSAGCNVLNALLKSPRQVIAIDLNPVQNQLLLFKKHLILHHEHAAFRAMMGFDGANAVAQTLGQIQPTLPADSQPIWTSFATSHPAGILMAGKLEGYLTGFLPTLAVPDQDKLRQLVQFDAVETQRDFFLSELHSGSFRNQFIHYFDEANLSKGRDPSLFKYANETGGEAFYNRLLRQVSTALVRTNFFLYFLFFGPDSLPESILPPCYRQANFQALRAQMHRLTVVDGEAIDYLLSDKGMSVSKASFSNIFEYVSESEFRRVCRLLQARNGQSLRFIFWNLLQEQGTFLNTDGWTDVPIPDQSLSGTACFYFNNVRVVEHHAGIPLSPFHEPAQLP